MSIAPALFRGAQDTRRLKISVLPIELHGQASNYRVSIFSGRAGQAIFLTAGGMGFIQSDSQGPAWVGIPSLGIGSTNGHYLAMEPEIQQLQAIGGDVMISFGGASGTGLAQTFSQNNQSAVAFKDSYLSLVNEFNLSHIDFRY